MPNMWILSRLEVTFCSYVLLAITRIAIICYICNLVHTLAVSSGYGTYLLSVIDSICEGYTWPHISEWGCRTFVSFSLKLVVFRISEKLSSLDTRFPKMHQIRFRLGPASDPHLWAFSSAPLQASILITATTCSGITRNSGAPGQKFKSSPPSPFPILSPSLFSLTPARPSLPSHSPPTYYSKPFSSPSSLPST